MSSFTMQILTISSFSTQKYPSSDFFTQLVQKKSPAKTRRIRRARIKILAMASANSDKNENPTKLITFLGKGGSGKTTSAIFAAQHYAMAGLKTCLVIHSQDPTAEYLLNCKIGTTPVMCNGNLSAVRLETTKMLLEPLNKLKQADARLNMTQGVLEGVVGEELGVLPGMDSIFSSLALERLVGFFGNIVQQNSKKEKFDIIIYDGMSTEETIRMIGATSKARLYLKYLRNVAEKTDLGRLASPSLLRLVDEAMTLSGRNLNLNGKTSSEIWDFLEQVLERGSTIFAEPKKFGCYLVVDRNGPASLASALRYWGCIIQAGAQVSGAFSLASPNSSGELGATINDFSPLPFAFVPHISMAAQLDWNNIMQHTHSESARNLLTMTANKTSIPPVIFDPANKNVTLLMPGFDKSEIKLYQFRGGSELLVEAGDQRRVIRLPSQLQGKVGGAKFADRNLTITMR
uniref:Uncharacterized protein At1g26090, chloroplastic-like isoform X1 n=2 Tax=Nicotiana tabacum TaxID=4097 RepID=A0A1S4CYI1_TOBAC|nr:PREDICTED: uncharacterized protein At1g26090, chloroplastic-like isoform X1 [Nicotiana tabacum]XP_016506059.1 PREDICTED: uncharacterized protein At1g26090, chloroplastic-like isoform X2 [Nicotiana tabacum]